MKRTIITTAFASLMITGSVMAADLASKAPYADLPGVQQNYIGVTVGTNVKGESKGNIGVVAGYEVNPNVTVEGQYEYRLNNDHLVSGNLLVGQQIGSVKPYGLVGVGHRWVVDGPSDYVWVAGVGVKAPVTENTDLDLRYRYVQPFNNGEADHRATIGFNYKF